MKVLEAMAIERAVVSTSSGCAGLGLEHGVSVWVADTPEDFAAGIRRLIGDHSLRREIAGAARRVAEANFDWRELGARQRTMWADLLSPEVAVRPASAADLAAVAAIQAASPEASAWEPSSYLDDGCLVGLLRGRIAGFVAFRMLGGIECEILNLAVAPPLRRRGVARALAGHVLALHAGPVFLEVRESNHAALKLYETLGFERVGTRPKYYRSPPEDGIVMKFQSC